MSACATCGAEVPDGAMCMHNRLVAANFNGKTYSVAMGNMDEYWKALAAGVKMTLDELQAWILARPSVTSLCLRVWPDQTISVEIHESGEVVAVSGCTSRLEDNVRDAQSAFRFQVAK